MCLSHSWDIGSLRERLAQFSVQGTLSEDVIAPLLRDGYGAPLEFEMLDFKEMIVPPVGIDRIAKAIVAMHNTFGGYLVFGVADIRNGMGFPVVGVDPTSINVEHLKDHVAANTDTRILLTGCTVAAKTATGNNVSVILVHIPQRRQGAEVVDFKKNAQSRTQKGKVEFSVGDFYFRNGDTTEKALGSKIFWLSGLRMNYYLPGGQHRELFNQKNARIQHNLPDRSAICPHFIRRESTLDLLWAWLGDDLSHWRVIAGEGGLGKSSVAYEFTEQLLRYPEHPFDQVIWLSAKQQQFDGIQNSYRRMPETHYHSFDELLTTLCLRLGHRDDEVAVSSQNDRRRMLRDGLTLIPSFVIIDDVDSLAIDEQKKVGELVAWLSGNDSRFLVTTRHNHTFSSVSSIRLDGFEKDEFNEFLDILAERLPSITSLNLRQRTELFDATLGSPLLAESVCRHLKYTTFDEALTNWRGKSGELARAAVLKKEIDQLSLEAKRVLVAASMSPSIALIELAQVTDYPKTIVEAAIDELDSLFLVARPKIGAEPRFAVNATTARLVLDYAQVLVSDHKRLAQRVRGNNQGSGLKPKANDSIVAAAIRQAAAHIKDGNVKQALATLDDAHHRRKHPDILSFKAKVLLDSSQPQFEDARKIAREAYTAGCRKPPLFDTWFQAEWALEQYTGALTAAEAAIKAKTPTEQAWYVRLSAAHKARAAERASTDVDGNIKDLISASRAMSKAVALSSASEKQQWLGKLFEMHDQIIEIRRSSSPTTLLDRFLLDDVEMMNKQGDTRRRLAWVVVNSIEKLTKTNKQKPPSSILIERANRIIQRRRSTNFDQAERDAVLFSEWDKILNHYSTANITMAPLS